MLKNIFILVPVVFFSCNYSAIKNKPDHEFHPGDMTIRIVNEYLYNQSELSSFLLEENASLSGAIDIAVVARDSSLFILNNSGEITKIDNRGKTVFSITSHRGLPGEIMTPREIKVRKDLLYLADPANNKIVVYTLEGIPIYDIVIDEMIIYTFELDNYGNIIIPNMDEERNNGNLFHVYDNKGERLRSFGNNSFLSRKVNMYGMPFEFRLNLTPGKKLLLTFVTTGEFYLFDGESGVLLNKFSIQGGPEWEQSIELEREFRKNFTGIRAFPLRVKNVSINSKGTVFCTWGGAFREENTVGMVFDSKGTFYGRIFGNESIPYVPTIFELENDNIAWIYSRGKDLLARIRLIPFHED